MYCPLTFPSTVPLSPEIKNLLQGLLNKDIKQRLGSIHGIREIFSHPWVGKVNRKVIDGRGLTPPFQPDLLGHNFDIEEARGNLEKIRKKIDEDIEIGN